MPRRISKRAERLAKMAAEPGLPRGRGRPPHDPTRVTRNSVLAMAGYGIPHVEIARVIGVDVITMRKHYGEELDKGNTIATAAVSQNLYRIARGTGREAVSAAMFWLRCRAGWSEYNPRPTAGPDADPLIGLGKKALADAEAKDAERGTSWDRLLN